MLLGSLTLGVVYAEPIYAFFGWPVGLFLFQKKIFFKVIHLRRIFLLLETFDLYS